MMKALLWVALMAAREADAYQPQGRSRPRRMPSPPPVKSSGKVATASAMAAAMMLGMLGTTP